MSPGALSKEAQDVLTALSRHIGADQGISVERLSWRVYGAGASQRDQRAIRRAVEELRREGHHVCADPARGYYLAATDAELDDTCRFLYNRAMTSLTQVAAMKRVSLPDLAGQLRIRLEDQP